MYSIIRPTLFSAKNSLSRTMSSLAPGSILQGACWNYRILKPIKGDKTHNSTIFKAEVLSTEQTHNSPQWFVVLAPYRLPG